jgi:hypothetical protein
MLVIRILVFKKIIKITKFNWFFNYTIVKLTNLKNNLKIKKIKDINHGEEI